MLTDVPYHLKQFCLIHQVDIKFYCWSEPLYRPVQKLQSTGSPPGPWSICVQAESRGPTCGRWSAPGWRLSGYQWPEIGSSGSVWIGCRTLQSWWILWECCWHWMHIQVAWKEFPLPARKNQNINTKRVFLKSFKI